MAATRVRRHPAWIRNRCVLPLLANTPDFLLHFLPYYLLTFWVFEEVGRAFGLRRLHRWLAPEVREPTSWQQKKDKDRLVTAATAIRSGSA